MYIYIIHYYTVKIPNFIYFTLIALLPHEILITLIDFLVAAHQQLPRPCYRGQDNAS